MNMVLTEKVRKLVKNKDAVGCVKFCGDLINGCKYIICGNLGYADYISGCKNSCFYARSIKERRYYKI